MNVVVGVLPRVPREFVRDGQMSLTLARTRPIGFDGQRGHYLQARFNGVAFPVIVPLDAVAAIYAKENGQAWLSRSAAEPVPLPRRRW
ncbi:MAG: hypothetical protein IPP18_15790 [Rhodocyclaceae bacterium]|nr:hypothetical protein [Rhodocyclaceae bacterium]